MNNKKHETFAGLPRSPLRFVWFMTKGYWKWGIPAFLAVTFASVLGASGPFLYAKIIDSAHQGNTEEVFFWVVTFVVISGLIFISWRLSGFMGMRFQLNVERTAHLKLFSYLLNHSQTYFNDKFAGSLSSKVSNGADGAEHLLESTLWGYYGIFLNIVITTIYITSVSTGMGIFFVCSVAFIIAINYFFVKKLLPLVVRYNDSTSRFRGSLVDSLTNISAVKSYVRRKDEQRRLQYKADERFEDNIAEWRYSEFILCVNNVFVFIIEAILFGGAVYFWANDLITVGILIMLFSVFLRVQENLIFIGNNIRSFIRIYGMIEEGLSEILVDHGLTDKPNAQKLVVKGGEIKWKDVYFAYEGENIFSGFDLTIKKGQRVGLVGESGAGKTTFVSLLLRQHDIDSGLICIDGQDIAGVTQDSLREHIAIVPQEPMLFHRTIRENIAYGKPKATKKEIEDVAKKAEAHKFITSLPEGYDTLVGERGVKLSGGQKQRIAIARAMLKDAPILVLDEATSALDSESEVAIQKALQKLMKGKTVIAIAHRLSTLREMDRIIVLEKGTIVEDGSHKSLVKNKKTYARLWEHQAGGFLTDG